MGEGIIAALTRRRLGGAVLLLAGIVVAAIVLWPSGDDAAKGPEKLPVRFVSVPPLGLGFAHPTTWQRRVSRRVIALRSPDRSISLLFSSPLARPAVALVKREAKRRLRRRFAPATIITERRQRLGLRRVPSFELKGRERGKVIRGLVLVGSTRYRTYAVTVLTGARPSRRRLQEARQIVATVRFGKPKALRSKR